MKSMLIEYMGRGFLDNIVALLRQDAALFRFIPEMLGDDSLHVRLGTVALVEELIKDRLQELRMAVPGVIELLGHANPTIRGDAAAVLGIIRDTEARAALLTLMHQDVHPGVREAAREALEEIGQGHSGLPQER